VQWWLASGFQDLLLCKIEGRGDGSAARSIATAERTCEVELKKCFLAKDKPHSNTHGDAFSLSATMNVRATFR